MCGFNQLLRISWLAIVSPRGIDWRYSQTRCIATVVVAAVLAIVLTLWALRIAPHPSSWVSTPAANWIVSVPENWPQPDESAISSVRGMRHEYRQQTRIRGSMLFADGLYWVNEVKFGVPWPAIQTLSVVETRHSGGSIQSHHVEPAARGMSVRLLDGVMYPLWIGIVINCALYIVMAYTATCYLSSCVRRFSTARRLLSHGHCLRCGYPTGVGDRCPECGQQY